MYNNKYCNHDSNSSTHPLSIDQQGDRVQNPGKGREQGIMQQKTERLYTHCKKKATLEEILGGRTKTLSLSTAHMSRIEIFWPVEARYCAYIPDTVIK